MGWAEGRSPLAGPSAEGLRYKLCALSFDRLRTRLAGKGGWSKGFLGAMLGPMFC